MKRLISVLLGAYDLLLLLVLLALPLLWLAGTEPLDGEELRLPIVWGVKPVVIALALLALRITVSAAWAGAVKGVRSLWRVMLVRRILLLHYSMFFCLMGAEFALGLMDFDASTPTFVIKGRNQEILEKNGIRPDAEMMWKFSPGGMFKGWKINSLGFREREIDPEKRPGAMRVISLGDSCTADGGPPYAGCLHQLLTNAPPTPTEWEAFNMGVYGYSSMQGLRLYHRKVKQLDPDIVTLYFGWNDHWLCGYRPDSHRMALALTPGKAIVYQMLRHKRFGQVLIKWLTPGQNIVIPRTDGEVDVAVEDMLRVPHDEYRLTLTRLATDIRADGGVPLFITAPCRVLPKEVLVSNKQAHSREDLNRLHDEFVEITREVARATGSPLLDLRAMFGDESEEPLFIGDGIHLRQQGLWRIGAELYNKIGAIEAGTPDQPYVSPKQAESPAGVWSGLVGNDTNFYAMTLTIAPLSEPGAIVGSFTNATLACAGDLRWDKTIDGTYFMSVENRQGECVEPETREYLRCLPDGTLLYASVGQATETVGTLYRVD